MFIYINNIIQNILCSRSTWGRRLSYLSCASCFSDSGLGQTCTDWKMDDLIKLCWFLQSHQGFFSGVGLTASSVSGRRHYATSSCVQLCFCSTIYHFKRPIGQSADNRPLKHYLGHADKMQMWLLSMWICDPLSGAPPLPLNTPYLLQPAFSHAFPKRRYVDIIRLKSHNGEFVQQGAPRYLSPSVALSLSLSLPFSLSLSLSLRSVGQIGTVSLATRLGTDKRWIEVLPLRFTRPDSSPLMASLL